MMMDPTLGETFSCIDARPGMDNRRERCRIEKTSLAGLGVAHVRGFGPGAGPRAGRATGGDLSMQDAFLDGPSAAPPSLPNVISSLARCLRLPSSMRWNEYRQSPNLPRSFVVAIIHSQAVRHIRSGCISGQDIFPADMKLNIIRRDKTKPLSRFHIKVV